VLPCTANWVCEQEPLQQTPHCTQVQQVVLEQEHAAGHQRQQVAAVDSRPPWQAARGAASATAGSLKAEVSEGSSTSRNVGRRVSISAANMRSSGHKKGCVSSSGGFPAAAFSSPEMAKTAATAAEKVRGFCADTVSLTPVVVLSLFFIPQQMVWT
jgi:hypothetical protein